MKDELQGVCAKPDVGACQTVGHAGAQPCRYASLFPGCLTTASATTSKRHDWDPTALTRQRGTECRTWAEQQGKKLLGDRCKGTRMRIFAPAAMDTHPNAPSICLSEVPRTRLDSSQRWLSWGTRRYHYSETRQSRPHQKPTGPRTILFYYSRPQGRARKCVGATLARSHLLGSLVSKIELCRVCLIRFPPTQGHGPSHGRAAMPQ